MGTITTDLKEAFRRGNIYIQLIYINVAVFVVTTLTEVILQLFNRSLGGVFEWLELPASFTQFIIQPWSLFTYMFMHAGFLHILFNMLWLYWFGALFLMFFSAKHLRGVYILGGICGGLLYMVAYNVFPYFRPMVDYSFMLGASASVLAIVAATAYREPNYPIRLFLFGTIRLKYLALIVIGTAGFDRPEVKGVMEGYPAEEAGLQAGDIIKEINGKNIHIYREVSVYTLFHSNENLEVTYERDGEEYTCTISPKYNEEAGRNLFGIYGNTMRERGNIFETIKYSVYEVKYWIEVTMDSLKMLVTGRVSVNELSGPVGIVKNIGDTYDESKSAGTLSVVLTLINYSIMLTANLGIMNLLPLPALDGGRLVFLIIEAVRKKRVDPDKEGMVHFVGLMLLLALMVLVMFNDIRKLF